MPGGRARCEGSPCVVLGLSTHGVCGCHAHWRHARGQGSGQATAGEPLLGTPLIGMASHPRRSAAVRRVSEAPGGTRWCSAHRCCITFRSRLLPCHNRSADAHNGACGPGQEVLDAAYRHSPSASCGADQPCRSPQTVVGINPPARGRCCPQGVTATRNTPSMRPESVSRERDTFRRIRQCV